MTADRRQKKTEIVSKKSLPVDFLCKFLYTSILYKARFKNIQSYEQKLKLISQLKKTGC